MGIGKIKGLTVTYCKKRVAAQREKRNLLCNLVEHLKRKIDNGSTSCVDAYKNALVNLGKLCLLYTSPSPRDGLLSRMPSSA